MSRADRVATLLADAFLDGPWLAPELARRGAHDLDAAGLTGSGLTGSGLTGSGLTGSGLTGFGRAGSGRARTDVDWLLRLAEAVVAAHPVAPLDAPRVLAAEIARHPELSPEAGWPVSRQPAGARPAHPVVLPRPQGMIRRPFDVPRLDGASDLADLLGLSLGHLEWFADVTGRQRRARAEALHHYRSRWVAKRGAPRLLEAPKPRLRAIQRVLLHQVLDAVPAHPVAHGFVRGRSAVSGARVHTDAAVVIRLDLAAFFSSVPAGRVHGLFRTLGYPEAVAHLLTGLCTHRTPLRVLSTMPDGGEGSDRFALRTALREAHLPQGAPTSPALANLAAHRLDRRLAGLADSLGATVTRYADDLTLSGGHDLAAGTDRLVRTVTRIAAAEGFRVNPAKTSVRGHGARQLVTGIVVNRRPNLPREEYDRLRAMLHNAVRDGPAGQNRAGHPDFRAHLLGRISWVAALNPARAARLRADFDRIVWPRDQR